MKKLLLHSLICIGLLTGSMASAVMGPKEMWQCLTKPNTCPEAKRKEARAWVIGIPVAVIVAALAAVGIIVGKGQVEKMREHEKTREEITAGMVTLSEELRLLKQKRAKTDADRTRIAELEREISRLNALRATVGQ